MKIIIEDKDLKEVQRIAHDYYAIVLTDEQAWFLIEKDTNLASELLGGSLDTMGRELLAQNIIDWAMKDVPPPTSKRLGGFWQGEWSWPCNGDSDEFKNEFNLEFRKAATNLNLELIAEVWDLKV